VQVAARLTRFTSSQAGIQSHSEMGRGGPGHPQIGQGARPTATPTAARRSLARRQAPRPHLRGIDYSTPAVVNQFGHQIQVHVMPASKITPGRGCDLTSVRPRADLSSNGYTAAR
jgi:hypothetical protein